MKHIKSRSILGMLALSLLFIVSCGNDKNATTNENIPTVDELESLSKQDTIRVTLNSNDKMQFDKSEITVFEGQTVILTLHHTGTMTLSAMGHNFVLLTKGTAISDFTKQALKAKDNAYIPTDEKNVIAYTGLIGGGESVSVTFKAPEKGIYDFLCSFPGHYSIMKGKFNVN
ncbi:azurin [Bizionia argentinensis JUB59]|uniref:Azurin n=1 Tax=Bizionia argentinensis JUB59 TaxID=1046627 RepID=G2EDU8_9FLAO|nr:azurin [Bizionia argentinensis]EGV43395.1 azurin [Bizionia argentinensis JUB59]